MIVKRPSCQLKSTDYMTAIQRISGLFSSFSQKVGKVRVRRRTAAISRPTVDWLNQVYSETRGDPSAQMGFLRHHQWNARPWLCKGWLSGSLVSAYRWWKVWRCGRDPRSYQSRNCAFGHNARHKKRPDVIATCLPGREDVSVAPVSVGPGALGSGSTIAGSN